MPPEQVTLALTGFSRVHQLEEVVSHDGQSEGLVEMLAMAAHSLPDELPVLHAVVREEALPPEGACHGHEIGEDHRRFGGRAELRQARRGAFKVLFGIIDGPQDAACPFGKPA